MPPNIAPPESCEDEDVLFRRLAAQATDPRIKAYHTERAEGRFSSPIAVRRAREERIDNVLSSMIWIRAKNMPKEKRDVSYQKVLFSINPWINLMLNFVVCFGLHV